MNKKQIGKVVKYVLERYGTCDHRYDIDCPRCLGSWIRAGIKKAMKKAK